MLPDQRFINQPKSFWAIIRSISQEIGYSSKSKVTVPTLMEIRSAFNSLSLSEAHIYIDGHPTELATTLIDYFTYRSNVLNDYVEPRLMDAARAKAEFDQLKAQLQPQCPLPMNKQKEEKKAEAFLTGIVNMIIEAHAAGLPCDYDPRALTTITRDGVPLRTLARRVDGAFPSAVNPLAIWEIKEYYYTTTFGSRVADGVYETLLDGLELEELREHENRHIHHYLMLDAHFTWWVKGKSYLCRIIDMLHMGYVDEVLFGYEVVERLPGIVQNWVQQHNSSV